MAELLPPHYNDIIEIPEYTVGVRSEPIRGTQNPPSYNDVYNTQLPTYNDICIQHQQQPLHIHLQPQPLQSNSITSISTQVSAPNLGSKFCKECWFCIYNPHEPSCCHCFCLYAFCQCFFGNYNKITNCPGDPCVWYDQEVCYPVSTQQQFCSDVCCPLRCLICLPCLGATFVKCQWNIVGDLIHCTKGIDYCCY